MKKGLFLFVFIMAVTASAFAQRFAYVNTDYILSNVPDFSDAQKKLDDISAGWQKEIDAKYKEIDNLNKSYQQEQVLLTDDMKQQRQKEIEDKEKAVKVFQKEKYGPGGELFKQKEELIKPIQDKVYDAIAKVAASKQYDFIFDKSNGVTMLYANTKLDVSDAVISQMGYTPKAPAKSVDDTKLPTDGKTPVPAGNNPANKTTTPGTNSPSSPVSPIKPNPNGTTNPNNTNKTNNPVPKK